jgi:hypothetical protein
METKNIKNLIYTIRDKQVILDSDVARLYDYDTKRINETVRRNKERFPESFCFRLTEEDYQILKSQIADSCKLYNSLRSQIATASNIKRNNRYLPYVFTEQRIAMLSGLLKNDIAIQVSINIMNAFVEMRNFISNNSHIFERLTNVEYKLLEHDKKFDILFDELQRDKVFEQKIFYKGQIYDSFSLIIDILRYAENKIIIIDNYIDKSIIDILSFKNDNVDITVVTNYNNLNKIIIDRFNSQYPDLKIINSNVFHDRFIIIDEKEIYHLGASLKDLGNKCFAILKIEDDYFIKYVIDTIQKNV